MGISGIYKEIGGGQRVALAKLASESLEKKGRPLRIAIDTSIWLYQVQSSKGGTNAPVRTFYYRLLRLLSLAIHPIFVFDGPHKPKFKRNKRVGNHAGAVPEYFARKMCGFFSFGTHSAPGEAEAECALLQREGIVDMVWSEDVDTLMFGSGHTIRNWSSEDGNNSPTHVNLYDATITKELSGLDREGMILVALMSGGDYLPEGLPGCGPKVACEAARAGFGHELCSLRDGDTRGLDIWRARLVHELRTNESKLFKRKPRSFDVPDSFPDKEVLKFYTHPVLSSVSQMSALKAGMAEVLEARQAGADMNAMREEWKRDKDKAKVYPSLRMFFELPVDFPAVRKFTADTFAWRTLDDAKHFIRSLAPAIVVRGLRLGTADKGPNPMVVSISSTRDHASTDNTPEMRVEYIPLRAVPIDLASEESNEVQPGSNPTISTGAQSAADDDLPVDDDSRQARSANAFEPEKVARVWVFEHVVRANASSCVAEWDAKQQLKAAKAAKRSARRPLERAQTALGLSTDPNRPALGEDVIERSRNNEVGPALETRRDEAEAVSQVRQGKTKQIAVLDLSGAPSAQSSAKGRKGSSTKATTAGSSTKGTIAGSSTKEITAGSSIKGTTAGSSTKEISAGSSTKGTISGSSTKGTIPGNPTNGTATGSSTKATTPGSSITGDAAGSPTKGHRKNRSTSRTTPFSNPEAQAHSNYKSKSGLTTFPSFQTPILDLSSPASATASTSATRLAPTCSNDFHRFPPECDLPPTLSTPTASRTSTLLDSATPRLSTPGRSSRTPFRRVETAPSALETPTRPAAPTWDRDRLQHHDLADDDFTDDDLSTLHSYTLKPKSLPIDCKARGRDNDGPTGVSPEKKKAKMDEDVLPRNTGLESGSGAMKLPSRPQFARPIANNKIAIRDLDLTALSDLDELPELDLETPIKPNTRVASERRRSLSLDLPLDSVELDAQSEEQAAPDAALEDGGADFGYDSFSAWSSGTYEATFMGGFTLEDIVEEPELGDDTNISDDRSIRLPGFSQAETLSSTFVSLASPRQSIPVNEGVIVLDLSSDPIEPLSSQFPTFEAAPAESIEGGESVDRNDETPAVGSTTTARGFGFMSEVTPPPQTFTSSQNYSTPELTPAGPGRFVRLEGVAKLVNRMEPLAEQDENDAEVTVLDFCADGTDSNARVPSRPTSRQSMLDGYSSPPMSPTRSVDGRVKDLDDLVSAIGFPLDNGSGDDGEVRNIGNQTPEAGPVLETSNDVTSTRATAAVLVSTTLTTTSIHTDRTKDEPFPSWVSSVSSFLETTTARTDKRRLRAEKKAASPQPPLSLSPSSSSSRTHLPPSTSKPISSTIRSKSITESTRTLTTGSKCVPIRPPHPINPDNHTHVAISPDGWSWSWSDLAGRTSRHSKPRSGLIVLPAPKVLDLSSSPLHLAAPPARDATSVGPSS